MCSVTDTCVYGIGTDASDTSQNVNVTATVLGTNRTNTSAANQLAASAQLASTGKSCHISGLMCV